MPGLNVRKGDRVIVVSGKEKGKRGKILRTLPEKKRVIVEGLNMVKRAVKPTQKNPQGGLIDKEGSIHVSNVMLLCDKCSKPGRIGFQKLEDGRRVRFCRACREVID